MAARTYYEILGIGKFASDVEIKRAYKDLARKYHPDKNPGDDEAAERFALINEAYKVLSDEQERRKYNARISSIFNVSSFNSVFGKSNVAKDFGKKARRVEVRGQDIEVDLPVSVSEAKTGHKYEVGYKKGCRCGYCDATGAEALKKCDKCSGTGELNGDRCDRCNGTGRVVDKKCDRCDGVGFVIKDSRIEITVPPDTADGTVLVAHGMGNCGLNGGPNGDLRLRVSIQPENGVSMDGKDVSVTIDASPVDLVLGGTIRMMYFGEEIDLNVPKGTQNGSKFRIGGKGIGGSDLVVTVKVVIPTALTEEELELYSKLKEKKNDVFVKVGSAGR